LCELKVRILKRQPVERVTGQIVVIWGTDLNEAIFYMLKPAALRSQASAGPLKTWYCPMIFWGEKVLFSFRPLADLSGRNARFGMSTQT